MQATVVASKGDPLYAELEHKKGKQSITPPDLTGVQYSEIKTDEVCMLGIIIMYYFTCTDNEFCILGTQ